MVNAVEEHSGTQRRMRSAIENSHDRESAVCVDMGTTNTRVWLVTGDDVLARAQAQVGVGDAAREGSTSRLRAALKSLIIEVCSGARDPSYVAAAGMITSSLGLAEIPHVEGPAGVRDLARSLQRRNFPDVAGVPFFLVPGVRIGPGRCRPEGVGETDMMRGEETLCVGLIERGLLKGPASLLTLGSHWKAIRIDEGNRIASSVTSMSGELIHAAQTKTILASAVPRDKPNSIDGPWLDAGMEEQRRSGLPRALFCVRLLEQRSDGSPEQRLSFLIGAFIAADLDALIGRGALRNDNSLVITGGGVLAQAWQRALSAVSIQPVALTDAETERGLLAGLRSVVGAAKRDGGPNETGIR